MLPSTNAASVEEANNSAIFRDVAGDTALQSANVKPSPRSERLARMDDTPSANGIASPGGKIERRILVCWTRSSRELESLNDASIALFLVASERPSTTVYNSKPEFEALDLWDGIIYIVVGNNTLTATVKKRLVLCTHIRWPTAAPIEPADMMPMQTVIVTKTR